MQLSSLSDILKTIIFSALIIEKTRIPNILNITKHNFRKDIWFLNYKDGYIIGIESCIEISAIVLEL